jgi:sialate O-acetylesterase
MRAAAEPADLSITSSDERDAPMTIKGVLVGDVWLCSGQSNMFWPLGKIGIYPGVDDGEAAIAAEPDLQLRLFCDDKHPLWQNRGWQAATPESRRPFSAVAYFYGARLRRELGVPIGLINVSRGGTPVQRWTPQAYAERVPLTRRFNQLFDRERARIDEYNRQHMQREKAARENRPLPAAPASLPADLMIARSFSGATAYERFIAPLVPYTLRGVIWYQGESNSGELEVAQSYAEMFKALVEGWRDAWAAPRLPFYCVQLPCREGGEFWPWTRQAMLLASRSIPFCDMIVSTDIGDPTNLHPPQKQPIGERLAAAALARSYGRAVAWAGPSIADIGTDGSAVVMTFDPTHGMPRPKDNLWQDVELAGADGAFHPATAQLSGHRATARSDRVSAPAAIRYGWRAVFTPTLFNEAGLPASGFYYVRDADGRWSIYGGR